MDAEKLLRYAAPLGSGVVSLVLLSQVVLKILDNPAAGSPTIWILVAVFVLLATWTAVSAFFADRRKAKELEGANHEAAALKRDAMFEVDPADPAAWGVDGDFSFDWYNAPYGLAIRELGDMNIAKMRDQHVRYRFLLVEDGNREMKREAREREHRCREFLRYLKNNQAPVESAIEVRKYCDPATCSLSFYLLKKNGKDTCIFYLGPLVYAGGKACHAFETYNEKVLGLMRKKFEDVWAESTPMRMDDLLK